MPAVLEAVAAAEVADDIVEPEGEDDIMDPEGEEVLENLETHDAPRGAGKRVLALRHHMHASS